MERDFSSSCRNNRAGPDHRPRYIAGRTEQVCLRPIITRIGWLLLVFLVLFMVASPVSALGHGVGRTIITGGHNPGNDTAPGTGTANNSVAAIRSIVDPAVTFSGSAAGSASLIHSAARVQNTTQLAGANPTPVLPRETRTPIQPGFVQKILERRLSTVEQRTVFFIALTLCALAVILFVLVRYRDKRRKPMGQKTGSTATPEDALSRATVIDPPSGSRDAGLPAVSPESAVRFPSSLERKFTGAELIGEGGLARVFRAQNAKTGLVVAVKVPVKFDETTGTHFSRDMQLWQGLCHENIIRMYSSNILPVPYIEMEYAPSSLAAMTMPVPEETALAIVTGVAHGLAYAHGRGIVHRDIKPENILIAADGTPKITDWGLGKAMSDPRQSVMISFSPAYAAPEQLAPHRFGKPGPQTDIYQLGVLLSELLTGTVPFGQEGFADMNHAILFDNPAVPSWEGTRVRKIQAVIAKCLEKRPEDRYGSVGEFLADLES